MKLKPIRVDMLILEYHPIVGGAQRQLAMLAPLLQERGVILRVLTRRYAGLEPYAEIEGVPVHRLPAPGPKLIAAGMYSLATLSHIGRQKPDVIHAYSLLSPLSTAVTAKRLFGIPIVAKVLRGNTLGDVYRVGQKPFGQRRLANYRRQVDAFVTISHEIDGELAGIGVPPERRIFIPNGVAVDQFCPLSPAEKTAVRQRLNLPPTGPIVIFTGRLAPEKRVEQLAALWPQVRASHPTATLLLVGDGPLAASLNQKKTAGVLLTGRVDNVADYLQAADLFVLPSSSEGLSNALLEGMAAGLGVIATAVGGAPDIITHQQNGWLIPPDDPPHLQEALLTLLANDGQRHRLGQQARQKMVAEFSLTAVADRLRLLYEQVLPPTTSPR